MLGLTGRARRCCFVALLGAFLTGCSALTDSFDAGPFLKEQITGDTWRACAAREYQAFARTRVRADRDWTEATAWAAKGRAALAGSTPTEGCACGRASALSELTAAHPNEATLKTKFDEARAACEKGAP